MYQGKLKKWQDERGFGFIKPEDGNEEVFLHISELKDPTRRPQVGDTIYYDVVTKNGKLRAYNASILGVSNKAISLSQSLSKSIPLGVIKKYPFPKLEALLLSILPVMGSFHCFWITSNPLPLILYPIMSLVTFFLYAEDKSRAKRGDWRISENMLHLCELAGGWWGGFIAQRRLRHKNIKSSYQIVFWTIVILHMAFWVGWLFLGKTLVSSVSKYTQIG